MLSFYLLYFYKTMISYSVAVRSMVSQALSLERMPEKTGFQASDIEVPVTGVGRLRHGALKADS